MPRLSKGENPTNVSLGRSAAVPSTHDLLRWVYLVRVALASVMFLAASLYFNAVPPSTIVAFAAAALASVSVTGLAIWHTHIRHSYPGKSFLYGQAVFDLILVTMIVHLTGGPDSQFFALFIVIIAVNSVMMPFQASLLVTALAGVLYTADIVLFHTGTLTVGIGLQIVLLVGVFSATGLLVSPVRTVTAESEVLKREVRRLRLEAADILSNIQSGVVTVDGQGKLIYANPAALDLLGLGGSEVIGQSFVDALDGCSPELCDVVFETQNHSHETLRAEGLVYGANHTFPIGVTTTALDVEGDGPCSVAAIFTDISDQKRIEELRLRTERLEAVAELSASLAHEIKNPLASIRSSVEQLLHSPRADEDERFLATLVVRESDRLSGLLTEFLDFSRVRVTDSRPLNIAHVVQGAVDVLHRHPECSQGVSVKVDSADAVIEGDEDLLHRIVVNLVLNAMQACENEARILIEAREALPEEVPGAYMMEDAALLRVSDDGPGIPGDLLERVFEPFVSGRVGGSGLGLAIVQRAVQAHRGVIFVDSEPGAGTSFTMLLPTKQHSEATS